MNPERCLNSTQRGHLYNIEETGVSILAVAASADEDATIWAYTIGLWQQDGHPEIAIFGLNFKLCGQLLNQFNRDIRDHKQQFLSATHSDAVLEGYTCYFERIAPEDFGEWFVGDQWFYDGNEFELVQMLWPEVDGFYPWEPSASDRFRRAQPIISALPKRALH